MVVVFDSDNLPEIPINVKFMNSILIFAINKIIIIINILQKIISNLNLQILALLCNITILFPRNCLLNGKTDINWQAGGVISISLESVLLRVCITTENGCLVSKNRAKLAHLLCNCGFSLSALCIF